MSQNDDTEHPQPAGDDEEFLGNLRAGISDQPDRPPRPRPQQGTYKHSIRQFKEDAQQSGKNKMWQAVAAVAFLIVIVQSAYMVKQPSKPAAGDTGTQQTASPPKGVVLAVHIKSGASWDAITEFFGDMDAEIVDSDINGPLNIRVLKNRVLDSEEVNTLVKTLSLHSAIDKVEAQAYNKTTD